MDTLKITTARNMITKIGGSIRDGRSGHAKISHPSMGETFPLPIHGRSGSRDLSPTVTRKFLAFYERMEAAARG